MFSAPVEEAEALFPQPRRGGWAAAAPPLKALGNDPATGEPLVVKDGRFGPYITDGKTNVTVPRGTEVEALDLDRAAELVAEKRAKGPAPKKRPAKKSTAKKGTAKKSSSSG